MYVLPESKWYIGEIIEEVTVEGEPRNIVSRNVTLIYAHSPEEAYRQALALVRETDTAQEDSARKLVHTRFWGLAELSVVHDDLKPGAALFYEEQIGVPGEKVHHWLLPRTTLNTYPSLEITSAPNLSAKQPTAQLNHARKPFSEP